MPVGADIGTIVILVRYANSPAMTIEPLNEFKKYFTGFFDYFIRPASRTERFRPPFKTTFIPLVPDASNGRRGLFSQTSTPCTK